MPQPTTEETQRAEQACRIVNALDIHEDDMNQKEHEFLCDISVKLKTYGLSTMVSVRQLDWLKDMHVKFIGYEFEE